MSRSTTAGPMGWSCWEPSPEERRSRRPCPRPWRRTRPWAGATTPPTTTCVTVDGDEASIDTQFITFDVVATAKPRAGGPSAPSAQGTVKPIESGYYRFAFRRTDGAWRIRHLDVIHDIPYVF